MLPKYLRGSHKSQSRNLWNNSVPAVTHIVMTDLFHLAKTGAEIAVRVTPKASRNRITLEEGQIRVYVTTVPEGGKANAAVQKVLAKAMGIAKSRLTLLRGQTARDKVFRVE